MVLCIAVAAMTAPAALAADPVPAEFQNAAWFFLNLA